ncbi:MAG: RNA methyltransferase [Candidatus Cloacimonetes bacterium]|nr:RNA methyltransferase [Candidatus Cloacimonadota bacterium]
MRFVRLEKLDSSYQLSARDKKHLQVIRSKFPLKIQAVCENVELSVELHQLGSDIVVKNVKELSELSTQGPVYYFPLIDSKRLEWGLEKLVELSVQEIQFYYSDHSTYNKKQIQKFNDRLDKLKNTVEEAQKQSGNLIKPILHPAVSLDKLFDHMDCPLVLGVHDDSILSATDIATMKSLVIGPEGDFSSREYKEFSKRNFVIKKLADPFILRTETALLYVASIRKFL